MPCWPGPTSARRSLVWSGSDNLCRGAVPFQPELVYNPTEQDQFFVKFGFAAGNGLNEVSPFVLAPWAADLEDDVKDINGRDRSYLLEAWYAHTFKLGEDHSVQITGGIVDPAFYVNENAYANDEYTQFMNEAFVNARNAFLPAYDWGGVLVWKLKDRTFSGVGMNVGENDDGNNYNYYAAEADYTSQPRWARATTGSWSRAPPRPIWTPAGRTWSPGRRSACPSTRP